MDIHTNIPLKNYTTMKLGGNARFMTEVRTPEEVQEVCRNASAQNLPVFILGGGSNVIVRDDGYNGIVVRNRIPGFEVIADEPGTTTLKIGAGENWDSVVKRTVDMNLSGIEAMSARIRSSAACLMASLAFSSDFCNSKYLLNVRSMIDAKRFKIFISSSLYFTSDQAYKQPTDMAKKCP